MLLCLTALPACAEFLSVRYGSRDEKRIAITVDDCYDAEHVRAIYDLCQQHGIQITYFTLGCVLKEEHAQLWQSIADAGHEIGNHSYGHKNLTSINNREVLNDLQRTEDKLDKLLGYHYPMQVMRPPYGIYNSALKRAIKQAGYLALVRWDVDETNPDKAFEAVQNGSILLFHSNKEDVACLERLIPMLLKAGYGCVTVSQLLGL